MFSKWVVAFNAIQKDFYGCILNYYYIYNKFYYLRLFYADTFCFVILVFIYIKILKKKKKKKKSKAFGIKAWYLKVPNSKTRVDLGRSSLVFSDVLTPIRNTQVLWVL